jgi:hypothetical protein
MKVSPAPLPLAISASLSKAAHPGIALGVAVLTLAATLLLVASTAQAASKLRVDGGVRVEHHNNIAREAVNEDSDVDRVARLGVGYVRSESGVNLELDYDAEYHDYLHDREEDESVLNGRAGLVWELMPQRLDFVLNHQVSQQLSDRQEANVSSNRELRSVITTGLDLTSNFSAVDSLIISPRFVDVRFEESDSSDSQHGSLGATWQRRLSAVSQVSLSGNYADVQFDDGINDYQSSSLLLGFATALSRLSYQLAVGANQFDRERGDKVDGFVVRANLRYDGDVTTWTGALVHELTDSAIGLSGQELALDGFVADDGNFDQFDIVERTQLDLGVEQRIGASHTLRFGVGARDDDYEEIVRDERGYFASANYRYTWNSFWSFGIDARAGKTEFLDDPLDLEYDDTFYRGYVDYRHSPVLLAQFALIREERDASQDDRSYTDNIAVISINYQFF